MTRHSSHTLVIVQFEQEQCQEKPAYRMFLVVSEAMKMALHKKRSQSTAALELSFH
jgi:hypothetical protein